MAGLPGDFWVNDLNIPIIPTGFDLTNWDKLWLGPIPKAWPGLCKIEASVSVDLESVQYTDETTLDLPPLFQMQKTYLIDKGYRAGKVRATIAIWDRISWLSLKAFMATVAPDVTSRIRPAYGIKHPATSLLGIHQVVVDGFAVYPPEEQTLYVDILMTQWFPYLTSKDLRDGTLAQPPVAVPIAGGNLA